MRNCWLLGAIVLISLAAQSLSQSSIRLEAGDVKGFFTSVVGLGSETEVIEHKIIGEDSREIVQKVPGRLKFFNITLKRPMAHDKGIWDWRKMIEEGKIATARRGAVVSLQDANASVIGSWSLVNCWPSSLEIVVADGVMTEQLVLVCEGIQRIP